MFNKKGINSIVSVVLFITLTLVAVIGFQNWEQNFSSNIYTGLQEDKQGAIYTSQIENIFSDTLYFQNSRNNLTIKQVLLNNEKCNITETDLKKGINNISLNNCFSKLYSSSVEIKVITNEDIYTKQVYLSRSQFNSINNLGSNIEYSGSCDSNPPLGFNGGDGSLGNPYQICSCAQLQNMSLDLDGHFILVDNIDCSETLTSNGGLGFEPIGCSNISWSLCDTRPEEAFVGSLNGNGKIISNFYINRPNQDFIGLIGYSREGEVYNVGIENSDIIGGDAVGCLVGANSIWDVPLLSIVDNSYCEGSVSGTYGVGGLVGYNMYSVVDNSYSVSDVLGQWAVGGLVGYNYIANIDNSYSISNVTGDEYIGGLVGFSGYWGSSKFSYIDNSYSISEVNGSNDVGGLVGYNYHAYIENSYSVSNVTGDYSIGGLVGWNGVWGYGDFSFIKNSSSSGKVNGTNNIGGLVGYNYQGYVDNSYSISNVTGVDYVGGLIGWNGVWDNYYSSYIDNSYSFAVVNGTNNVGGLVGYNYHSYIDNSYSFAVVNGTNNVGGLIGWNGVWTRTNITTINNTFTKSTVSGVDYVGGLIGYNYYSYVDNSYSVSNVTGSSQIAGLVGYNYYYGDIDNSYWNQDLYATSPEGGGLTTVEMKAQGSYTGFDFIEIWGLIPSINDGYPYLESLFKVNCNLDGVKILNGSSITAYSSKYVSNLGDCQSIQRTCNLGVLDGDNNYKYSSCTLDCEFNGEEVLNGNSITAYLDSFAPYGSSCSNIVRTCNDGILDGDNNYNNSICELKYIDYLNSLTNNNLYGAYDIEIIGNIAYVVSDNDDSFTIWDVSNPSNIVLLDEYDSSTYLDGAIHLAIENNVAYIVSYLDDSFTTWNVSNPNNIVFLDEYDSSTYLDGAYDISISGDVAYITAYSDSSFTTWNVSDPSNIVFLDEYDSTTYLYGARGIEVIGNIAYIVSYLDDSFTTWNVSNPNNIVLLDEYDSSTYLDGAVEVEIKNNIAYIVSAYDDSFTTWNVSNPNNIVLLDEYDSTTYLEGSWDIEINENFAYIVSAFNNYVSVWNITDPSNINFLQKIENSNINAPRDLEFLDEYLYVVSDYSNNLAIFNLYGFSGGNCYLSDGVILNASSSLTYVESSVPFGGSCSVPINRTCTNGVLDGDNSYKYLSCSVSGPADCLFDDEFVIPHNSNVTAYITPSVPFGNSCPAPITRTCTNGVLDGVNDYAFASCEVTPNFSFPMNTDLSSASASFIGEGVSDFFGQSVSGVGDVNGDGFDDFLIGADWNAEGGTRAGQSYLFLGKNGPWYMDTSLSSASASFIGEATEDLSGDCVSGVGDVNGDGFDDFMIGAFGNAEGGSSNTGQAYLILGKSSGWSRDVNLSSVDASFIGEGAGDYLGREISGVGDVNGDGFDDFLIGAYLNDENFINSGQAYLFFGKNSGWSMDTDLSSANASFIGEGSSNYGGGSVSGVGDVNGDGFDDFLIGASGNDGGSLNGGQTYLFFGRSDGWSVDASLSSANASFIGEAVDDYSGGVASGVGDVNGDGFDDFMIGSGNNDEGGDSAGQAYLIFGKSSGWSMGVSLSSSDASFIGEVSGDSAGKSIKGVGDVNNDSFDDFMIGSESNDEGGDSAGQAYLIFGKSSGWSMDTSLSFANASFIGEVSGDLAGGSFSGVGDVNGDGFDDLLIGARSNDEGGSRTGQSYLILGGPPIVD